MLTYIMPNTVMPPSPPTHAHVPGTFAPTSRRGLLWILGGALLLMFLLSLFLGRYPSPPGFPPGLLASDPMAQNLVWNLRLPRALLAILVGASLAVSGNVLQLLFRNPLVEPGFLGVSQGAAFGASLALVLLGGSLAAAQGLAAFFALLGLAISVFVARRIRYGGWVLRLILAGIAVSAFFAAGVGLLKYVADPLTQLPDIVFWLLGGLWGSGWSQLGLVAAVALPCLAMLSLLRWRLDLLSLEEFTTRSLGVGGSLERSLVLLAAVLPVAAATAVAGIVGWVGLIIPQAARRLAGAGARGSLPVSLLLGALFLLATDTLGRTLTSGEIPLGILTALIGAILFLWIMSLPESREVKP
jgi:iron complex transport system permease protein